MIYEKKTIELLADQRLLSRFNKNTLKLNNNSNSNSNSNNNNIVTNISNKYFITSHNLNNLTKYMNYIVLFINMILINYL